MIRIASPLMYENEIITKNETMGFSARISQKYLSFRFRITVFRRTIIGPFSKIMEFGVTRGIYVQNHSV